MPSNFFKSEKDALAFLGLMSHMFINFDEQFKAPDGERTHTNGLNIHALIVDNVSGNVLGMQKNIIHQSNNPLLHAEQLTLKEAIEAKNILNPRDPLSTSVESYYRNFLFNDPLSYDALKVGATIYTTLEPCPFCTSALLVSRVKRIVFITPDPVYGNSFYNLWTTYYKKYDVHYEQMKIEFIGESDIVTKSINFLKLILEKTTSQNIPGTLYFDVLKNDLQSISDFFQTLTKDQLCTVGEDLEINALFLSTLQNKIHQSGAVGSEKL
jgi:tRNA(Arg) A34 adenosine deaminase TadA